jgi:hypothetical protein
MTDSYEIIVNNCVTFDNYQESKNLEDVAEQIKNRIFYEMKNLGFDEEEMNEFDAITPIVDRLIKRDRYMKNKFGNLFPLKVDEKYNETLDKLADLVIEKIEEELENL